MDNSLSLFDILIIIVFGVLSIILFFKVWRMCNDVRDIKNLVFFLSNHPSSAEDAQPSEGSSVEGEYTGKFKVGQLVIVKNDESQFRINSVTKNGEALSYYSEKFNRFFTEDEIDDFDKYWKEKKR